MYNWDYDLPKNWKPKTPDEWEWYLTRIINYGLGGEKINPIILKKYLPRLKVDPKRKVFLEFLLTHYENLAY
ncbi:hypothetical protein HY407_00825 [Candidatus Gottesmanbacteria bacterium]|nr:hypothetical protein [Candidatus Gottesmanbacteria bacterium]